MGQIMHLKIPSSKDYVIYGKKVNDMSNVETRPLLTNPFGEIDCSLWVIKNAKKSPLISFLMAIYCSIKLYQYTTLRFAFRSIVKKIILLRAVWKKKRFINIKSEIYADLG